MDPADVVPDALVAQLRARFAADQGQVVDDLVASAKPRVLQAAREVLESSSVQENVARVDAAISGSLRRSLIGAYAAGTALTLIGAFLMVRSTR